MGGSGNDVLKGGAGNDWLLGGLETDQLEGNAGRDILVGGKGADNLLGGDDDDLLLGGSLQYYNETTGVMSKASLDLIMREWGSLHGYTERISNLLGSGTTGLNGGVRITPTTSRDTAIDDLTGAAGSDWFISESMDRLKDRALLEIVSLA